MENLPKKSQSEEKDSNEHTVYVCYEEKYNNLLIGHKKSKVVALKIALTKHISSYVKDSV